MLTKHIYHACNTACYYSSSCTFFCSFFHQIFTKSLFLHTWPFLHISMVFILHFCSSLTCFSLFLWQKTCNDRVSSQPQTWTIACPRVTCLHCKFEIEKQFASITSEHPHMNFVLPDHHSRFHLQSEKFRKHHQSLTSTQHVSHLTMTRSLDRVASQSTCKIVYTELDHVLIEFVKEIKTHTLEGFFDCNLAYV